MSSINRLGSFVDLFSTAAATFGSVPKNETSTSGDLFPENLNEIQLFSDDPSVKREEFRSAENLVALALRNKFAVAGEAAPGFAAENKVSEKFIDGKADALINQSKTIVKKIDPDKLMNALARQATKNPKAVAAALYRPAIAGERYDYAKGLAMRLSDAELKQLSQTELGRSFLRSMMDIVYTEAPPERGKTESAVWREIDSNLLGRVQSKVFEYSGKQWSETKPLATDELQGDKAKKLAAPADAAINLGKVSVKEIDPGKLMNVLAKEAVKRPATVAAAVYRPEVRADAYEYAKGVLNRLSDRDLQELTRTEPGRNLLRNLHNTTLSEAPPERATNKQWLDGEMRLLGRVTGAIDADNRQRAEFRGVSADQLAQAMQNYGLSRERAEEMLPALNQAMYEYKIDTPLKQAAFLAQISVETRGLNDADFKEDYGERAGYAPYFGRGAIQLTLKDAYESATGYFGKDFLDNLDSVADKENAFQTAGWFWTKYKPRDANQMLSGDPTKTLSEFNRISLMVNGGTNGYTERMANFKNALEALGVEGRETIIQDIDKAVGAKK